MNEPYFLYADSNVDDKNCLSKMLRDYNPLQKLIVVTNGFELIQFLQEVQQGDSYPTLIIMGECMQRLDGFATLELLKSDDIYCLIPVVILCSVNGDKSPEVYNHLGAVVITKGSDMNSWKKVAEGLCEYNY